MPTKNLVLYDRRLLDTRKVLVDECVPATPHPGLYRFTRKGEFQCEPGETLRICSTTSPDLENPTDPKYFAAAKVIHSYQTGKGRNLTTQIQVEIPR